VRAVVAGYLRPNVPRATQHVISQLEPIAPISDLLTSVGCPDWTIEGLIWETHRPSSAASGEHARRAYMELAALAAIHRKHSGHQPRRATAHSVRSLGRRVAQLPHPLTNDQRAAVKGIAAKLAEPVAMRAILAADVGTGKSWVALVLAAALADVGARTIIMAPTYPLAVQLAEEFARLYSDVTSCLVADNHDDTHASTAMVVVGTSAVLTRELGQFDLVVVDEQQRWSRAQREHYVAANTHLLEMSATCIPRTQALIQFGKVAVFPMRETHAPKTIHTYLWEGDGAEMFRQVAGAINAGRPVMVIYPKRESTDDGAPKGARKGRGKETPQAGGIDDRHSIEQALPRWEAKYPGRVRAMTGEDLNEVKAAAIDDIRDGRAQILLTTTVVEVGISVANLFDIVVVHPDRYGVTTLHQLRGRVARNGGEGHCHLWCPGPISAKTRDRLDAVLSTTDGFKLAEMDLQQRGTGDLGSESSTQSGADQTMLFGVPLTVELIESVMPHWDYFSGRSVSSQPGD
jgi:ATP-dependent DNA helicase RecG